MENKTAAQMLEEEKEYLMPSLPQFDCAVVKNYRVNKYSTVNIDSCFYSVPDNLVDKLVLAKVYTDKIILFHEGVKIAQHNKLLGFGKWSLDINHYLNTLRKKPGALPNSVALQQAHSKIKNLYEKYYIKKEREFIELILFMREYNISINQVETAISKILSISPMDVSTEKIKILCTKQNIVSIHRKDEIYQNSKSMLELYGSFLNINKDNFNNREVIQ